MDAFVENILVRARERQRLLKEYGAATPLKETTNASTSEPALSETKKVPDLKEVVSESNLSGKPAQKENVSQGNAPKFIRQNSVTRVSSELPGSPLPLQKTLSIERDDFNLEIKLSSAENVRVQVEIEEDSGGDLGGQPGLREESKNRLKRLGKLYAGGEDADISSPIHRTEARFYRNDEDNNEKKVEKNKDGGNSKKGLSKLADLAQTINEWQDDLSHPTPNASDKPIAKAQKPQVPESVHDQSPQKRTPPKKYKAPQPPTPKGQNPVVDGPSKVLRLSPTKGNENSRSPGRVDRLSPNKGAQCVGATPKKLNWDQKVLESLESQGFTRTTSSSRLVYSYNSQDKNDVKKHQSSSETIPEETEEPPSKVNQLSSKIEEKLPKSPVKTGAVAKQSALFESRGSQIKNAKDPALLSVSERKALFEKNKGAALVPKAAFAMSAPVKVDTVMKASETKLIGAKSNVNLKKVVQKEKTPPKKGPAPKPPKIAEENQQVQTVATVHQSEGIASKMAALLESKSTISQEQIEKKTREQRNKDLDLLLNRFNKNKEGTEETVKEVAEESESDSDNENVTEMTAMIKERAARIVKGPSKENVSAKLVDRKSGGKRSSADDSPKVISVVEEVKRIKISPPKAGRLYPNLSDIEAATETETRSPSPDSSSSDENNESGSDDANTSFGRDILQVVCQNQTPHKRSTNDDSTTDDNNSSLMEDLDEILDEYEEELLATGPTPPKQLKYPSPQKNAPQPSNSFHYKGFQSPAKPKPDADLPEYVIEGDSVLPLTHTVSFYRKQQSQAGTPVRQISRQPIIEEEGSRDESDDKGAVDGKIKGLQEEVRKQENIISQTSQALNLCNSTPEFSGSTEQVEADKVLLVATHRRQAALHELQRLKVERSLRPLGKNSNKPPLEKGTLTISDIVLPMKRKYVTALAAAGGKGHHVVCLIKCGEQVVPTKLVSTVASSSKNPDLELCVPGSITLNDVYSDCAVTFEVYCLQAQEECLPHEVKYHINKKGVSTPKKSKHDSRLVRKMTESPAGPQAVRSSSFALMGCVVFSVQTCTRKSWSLINTPPMSPLEGVVEMRVSCELAVSVEHRGFLTMFEDISGFGAWHRRWCMLRGDVLCYWKYPDDEKKMAPIDTIDLKDSINDRIGPVSRDICARLHTFLIETERPAHPHDKDTLVLVRKGNKTIIRHLLSADTKEERIEWCEKFNSALTASRMWGNRQ